MKRDQFIEIYIQKINSGKSLNNVLGLIYDTHINLKASIDTLPRKDKIKVILSLILIEYNISLSQLKMKTRKREIVEARQIAAYLIRNNTDLPFSDIGFELGGLDHATIMYSCKVINNLLETDKEFKIKFQQIINKLKKKTS